MRENPGFGSRTQLKHDTVDAAAPISHIICGYPASGGHLDFGVYRVLTRSTFILLDRVYGFFRK